LFEPKIYKSNNLEAYHLITEDGGSFLYEGKVDYSEDQIFKDEQGKAYYRVTTSIGGDATYYVEVEPLGTPIPPAQKKDKTISDLIMASPRDEPADKKPGPEKPMAETADIEPAVPAADIEPVVPFPPEKQPDNCFESPENPPTSAAREETKEETPAFRPSVTEEAQAAVKAMASLPDHKPKKKRSLLLPVIGVILIILIIAAAGVYVYKLDLVGNIKHHLMTDATPTPGPMVTATPVPTVAPTATPEPTPSIPDGTALLTSLSQIAPAIDSNNSTVVAFANAHVNVPGGSYSPLAKACDIFDYVNANWVMANGTSAPQSAVVSVKTLTGDGRDYSILMVSLMRTLGYDSRVVAAYDGTDLYYYPQTDISKNEVGYHEAQSYLRGRYNVTNPYFYPTQPDYWLSMAMGNTVGVNVTATDQYSIDSSGGNIKL
jgi:hypothetical protein